MFLNKIKYHYNQSNINKHMFYMNSSLADVPILHFLKIAENLWFSGVFKGYKRGTLARNGLIIYIIDSFMTVVPII